MSCSFLLSQRKLMRTSFQRILITFPLGFHSRSLLGDGEDGQTGSTILRDDFPWENQCGSRCLEHSKQVLRFSHQSVFLNLFSPLGRFSFLVLELLKAKQINKNYVFHCLICSCCFRCRSCHQKCLCNYIWERFSSTSQFLGHNIPQLLSSLFR